MKDKTMPMKEGDMVSQLKRVEKDMEKMNGISGKDRVILKRGGDKMGVNGHVPFPKM